MLFPGRWRGWSRNTPGRSRFKAASHRGRALPLISRPSGASPSISTASSDIILSSMFSDPKEKVQTVHETVNILLVDNEPGGLLALEAILEPLGQKLITARSGQEALRQLLAHDFALILLDIQMPELDGFQTAALIRERERGPGVPRLRRGRGGLRLQTPSAGNSPLQSVGIRRAGPDHGSGAQAGGAARGRKQGPRKLQLFGLP